MKIVSLFTFINPIVYQSAWMLKALLVFLQALESVLFSFFKQSLSLLSLSKPEAASRHYFYALQLFTRLKGNMYLGF